MSEVFQLLQSIVAANGNGNRAIQSLLSNVDLAALKPKERRRLQNRLAFWIKSIEDSAARAVKILDEANQEI